MDEREIIDAFVQGRIGQWEVFRRVRALGVSAAVALAIAGALPGVVAAGNTQPLEGILAPIPDDGKALSRMLEHLAQVLQKVVGGGPDRPLATTLARLAANNADLLNDPNSGGNVPLNLQGANFALNGELSFEEGPTRNNNNINLVLNGNIGSLPLNLEGSIELLPAVRPGLNIGNVNLDVDGNIGSIPINLLGNIGEGP